MTTNTLTAHLLQPKPASPRPVINASAQAELDYRAWLRSFLKPRGYRPERKS